MVVQPVAGSYYPPEVLVCWTRPVRINHIQGSHMSYGQEVGAPC